MQPPTMKGLNDMKKDSVSWPNSESCKNIKGKNGKKIKAEARFNLHGGSMPYCIWWWNATFFRNVSCTFYSHGMWILFKFLLALNTSFLLVFSDLLSNLHVIQFQISSLKNIPFIHTRMHMYVWCYYTQKKKNINMCIYTYLTW